MQGFPIGGSRIRLSWGRSQCKHRPCRKCISAANRRRLTLDKAAQAAAQAAQAAALQAQAQYQVQMASPQAPTLSAEQAMQLLEKFGITQYVHKQNEDGNSGINSGDNGVNEILSDNLQGHHNDVNILQARPISAEQAALDFVVQQQFDAYGTSAFDHLHPAAQFNTSTFSPFSPDPSYAPDSVKNRESVSVSPGPTQTYPSKGYAPWYSSSQHGEKINSAGASGKVSPTSAYASRPPSARAFGDFLSEQSTPFPLPNRASSRGENPISRPELSRKSSHSMPLPSQDPFGTQDKHDHDTFHDLTSTLAGFSLGDHGMPWKTSEGASSISS
jgi:hypothetical protein